MTLAQWPIVTLLVGLACGIVIGKMLTRRTRVPAPAALPQAPRSSDSIEPGLEPVVWALPIGVIVVDRALRLEFANAAAGTTFGFDARHTRNMHIIEAIPNVELERRVADALQGEASVAPVVLGGAADQRTYRVAISPLTADDGGALHALIVSDDQTGLVRLDRARKEFLSNVSHELRTPLSSIKLMLETVLEAPEEEARDLFLPQALAQVDRLTALVGQLLEQARAESGQLKLNLRDVDLEQVARPIVASFEQHAGNKGIELELSTLRPVRVEADADRLSQVFVNLIDNALRHTAEGGRIRIEIDARDSDAVLRVRDTGEGIPYRDLPHIFERFYVVDRSRTRVSGGAGLGLAIVKGIVDAHGGTISAESMVGRGTAFTIRLPIMRIRR
ncbi:MAG: PAS domain-containing protein [Candidatus Eremiobacteraeota bacterium]|nr:PAS domain-containing protein [Candidatus Eremiobacteraeota bacterium]